MPNHNVTYYARWASIPTTWDLWYPSSVVTFSSVNPGYTAQPARTIAIDNFGPGWLNFITASMTYGGQAFEIVQQPPSIVPVGNINSGSLQVRPRTGLPIGTHEGELTVMSENGGSVTIHLSFTVNQPPVTFTPTNPTSIIHVGAGVNGRVPITVTGPARLRSTGILPSFNSDPVLYNAVGNQIAVGTDSVIHFEYIVPPGQHTVFAGTRSNVSRGYQLTATFPVDITWNYNNGTGSSSEFLYPYDLFSSLTVPTRVGYTFAGWFTHQVGGLEITGSDTVPGVNAAYFARWVPNSGSITGTVRPSAVEAGIPSVHVALINLETGGRQNTMTDAQGAYQFNSIGNGTYRLVFTQSGRNARVSDVATMNNNVLTINETNFVAGNNHRILIAHLSGLPVQNISGANVVLGNRAWLQLQAKNKICPVNKTESPHRSGE